MSESKKHMDLVSAIYEYCKSIVPEEEQQLIQRDSPSTEKPNKVVGGFIPDVYYWHHDLLVIGEAKTLHDFDNRHSKSQIESYLKECETFYGKSFLIIAVPWQLVNSVKNYIRRIRKGTGGKTTVIILNELGIIELGRS